MFVSLLCHADSRMRTTSPQVIQEHSILNFEPPPFRKTHLVNYICNYIPYHSASVFQISRKKLPYDLTTVDY